MLSYEERQLLVRRLLWAHVRKERAQLSDKQAAYLADMSPRKACSTGRRGGKTHVVGVEERTVLSTPKTHTLHLCPTLTSQSASTIWRYMTESVSKSRAKVWTHQTYKQIEHYDARYEIIGIDSAAAAEKLRGGAYDFVAIDECGAWHDKLLKYVVVEVIEPALLERKGRLVLHGTHGDERGLFYHAFDDDSPWSRHVWDCRDNPYAAPPSERWRYREYIAEWLADFRQRNNLTEESLEYVVEWLGGRPSDRLADSEYLLAIADLELVDWPTNADDLIAIGIDVGIDDKCGAAFITADPRGPVLASCWQKQMDPITLGNALTNVLRHFRQSEVVYEPDPIERAFGAVTERRTIRPKSPIIAVDTQGQGAAWLATWAHTHAELYQACRPAKKTGRDRQLHIVRWALRSKQAHWSAKYANERDAVASIPRDADRHPGMHMLDAIRYGFVAALEELGVNEAVD